MSDTLATFPSTSASGASPQWETQLTQIQQVLSQLSMATQSLSSLVSTMQQHQKKRHQTSGHANETQRSHKRPKHKQRERAPEVKSDVQDESRQSTEAPTFHPSADQPPNNSASPALTSDSSDSTVSDSSNDTASIYSDEDSCGLLLNNARGGAEDEAEFHTDNSKNQEPENSMSSQLRAAARRNRTRTNKHNRMSAPLPSTIPFPLIVPNSAASSSAASSAVSQQLHSPVKHASSSASFRTGSIDSLDLLHLSQRAPFHMHSQSTSAILPCNSAIPLDMPEIAPPPTLTAAQAHMRALQLAAESLSPSRVFASARNSAASRASFSPAGSVSATTSPLHRGHSQSVFTDASELVLQSSTVIKLNVGGTLFCTSLTTLLREPSSFFSSLFSGRFAMQQDASSGGGKRDAIFIDRDPTLFRHVLNYLRDGSLGLEGMTNVNKRALMKEAKFFSLSGLIALLQLDSRAVKTAQRRELSSEKEYKLVEDVAMKDMTAVIKAHTMEEGYEFENWILSSSVCVKSNSKNSSTTSATVHLLFSKKLSRGELMLLDRLQNHM